MLENPPARDHFFAPTNTAVVAARNTICMIALAGKRVAVRPPMLIACRAARTFAGKTAMSSSVRPSAATGAALGISSPTAPRISQIPETVTSRPGRGRASGTIRIRSSRRFPQCADAVSRNIAANAIRSAVHQPEGKISKRKTAISKMRGCMADRPYFRFFTHRLQPSPSARV